MFQVIQLALIVNFRKWLCREKASLFCFNVEGAEDMLKSFCLRQIYEPFVIIRNYYGGFAE
ncbi:MAG: hypothetical protein XD63_1472 [Thermoanaerobacterales bacterium 50_218]|nr:MAG: hypothetical protein XD63_1472 [Thermoanaerobacterales bacterium 50_218]